MTKKPVTEQIDTWNRDVLSVPTWNEILQFEYVRQSGKLNMFTDNVFKHAIDAGLFDLVDWYLRCKENNTSPLQMYSKVITSFEAEHGPRSGWISKSMKAEIEKASVQFEIQRLKMKLRELEDS